MLKAFLSELFVLTFLILIILLDKPWPYLLDTDNFIKDSNELTIANLATTIEENELLQKIFTPQMKFKG